MFIELQNTTKITCTGSYSTFGVTEINLYSHSSFFHFMFVVNKLGNLSVEKKSAGPNLVQDEH